MQPERFNANLYTVLVCGSRTWTNEEVVRERIGGLRSASAGGLPIAVVHGDARGADRMAAAEANLHGFVTFPIPADWEKYGRRAGIVRNLEMLDLGPDLVLAFWDGDSPGTKYTIDEACRRGIKTDVVLDA